MNTCHWDNHKLIRLPIRFSSDITFLYWNFFQKINVEIEGLLFICNCKFVRLYRTKRVGMDLYDVQRVILVSVDGS